jgi:transcriptional regulator GlxA family with amidase domain
VGDGEQIKSVVVVVFDGVERLDFECPLAVLGWTAFALGSTIDFRLVSKTGGEVKDHLLKRPIRVDGSTMGVAACDLLIVPGGNPKDFVDDDQLVAEIGRLCALSKNVASICTGAFLVAKAGLARGRNLTTHWQFHTQFRQMFPDVTLAPDRRYERDGDLWSSAGISAAMDMSLRLVESTWGPPIAKKVQGFLEYFPEPPYSRQEVIDA